MAPGSTNAFLQPNSLWRLNDGPVRRLSFGLSIPNRIEEDSRLEPQAVLLGTRTVAPLGSHQMRERAGWRN